MQNAHVRALRLTLGGDRRTVYEVREGESVTIGRDPGCTIQLNHHSVSPVHCLVESRPDGFVLADLNSAAGVIHDGKRYKHLPLKGGMTLLLGQISLTCDLGHAEAAAPAPLRAAPGPRPRFLGRVRRKRPPAAALEELRGSALSVVARGPAFFVSLLVHLAALLLVYDVPYLRFAQYNSENILVKVERPADSSLVEDTEPPEDLVFDDPPPLPEIASSDPWALEPKPDPEGRMRIDPGIIGTGGRAGNPGAGPGAGLAGLHGLSQGAQDYIAGLRRSGVDVAFVMDTTSSMENFLHEAKAVVDRLITGLTAVVPDLRMAIVAYRDRDDAYVTHALEFSSDRYEILNFLELLAAEGGGDEEEALYEGLNRCIRHLFWREGAGRVVLLVGDSGYHREDEGRIMRLLEGFKAEHGIVHAVFVGENEGGDAPSAGLESYRRIAAATGGECVQLAEHGRIFKTMVRLAFDGAFEPDVSLLAEKSQQTRTDLYIMRKARSGDRGWLLEKLKKTPVHPRLVTELIDNASQKELAVLVDYLESGEVSTRTKWAALYILRKTIKKPIAYNPNMPGDDQKAQLRAIRQMVADYPRQEVASPFRVRSQPASADRDDPRRSSAK